MNTNEMRNLTKEISEKRAWQDVKRQEDDKRRLIEMAKKAVNAKKASYARQVKSQKRGKSTNATMWMRRALLPAVAIASFVLVASLCSEIFQQKTAEIAGEDRSRLSRFAGEVILDYKNGGGGKLKPKWSCCTSRQIMEKGCGRLESFSKFGKPEIQEMAYDTRTSCHLIRYENQSDESLTMKVARIKKGGLALVGIH